MKKRKLNNMNIVVAECSNLLEVVEFIADGLNIDVDLAVSLLLLRELIILNRQVLRILSE